MNHTVFVCQNCSAIYSKWQGQCSQCGSWDSLLESVKENKSKLLKNQKKVNLEKFIITAKNLTNLNASFSRFSTTIQEFDRCLGGEDHIFGLTQGSVVLLSGEPGIGKSTLLTMAMLKFLKNYEFFKIFYICGEESPEQINLRIKRLININQLSSYQDRLQFITTIDVDDIISLLEKEKPSLVIVDSIQAIQTSDLSSSIGSLSQVKECAQRLNAVAKSNHIPMFLIGHLTKDGSIAGPKSLEHLVDTVLELTGERFLDLRILRSIKNRFGSTDEVGIFKMTSDGLEEVSNAGLFFLNNQNERIGNAVGCIMEGLRPLLVQTEALVVASQLAMPRRVGRGIEISRIQVLSAVLQKYAKLPFGMSDIFVSVVGGLNIKEPSIDLALLVSLVSSFLDKKIPSESVFIGEVGLLGEIKIVSSLERRVKEVERMGFKNIYSVKNFKNIIDLLKHLIFL